MQINSERLIIRSILETDAEAIFKYRSDAETNKHQGWIPVNIEEAVDFIENKTSPEINIPETWHQLVIFTKINHELIGDIGLHFIETDHELVEIGFTLSHKYQGKGYAFEAVRETINYLFKSLGKTKIIAEIDAENLKSITLVTRLGFQERPADFKFDESKIYLLFELQKVD